MAQPLFSPQAGKGPMWPPLLSVSERGGIVNMEQGLRGFILLVKIEREGKREERREKKIVALGDRD